MQHVAVLANVDQGLLNTCRLAQAVLSREDSQETFFKAIPSEVSDVEIIYPVMPSPSPEDMLLGQKVNACMPAASQSPRQSKTDLALSLTCVASPIHSKEVSSTWALDFLLPG